MRNVLLSQLDRENNRLNHAGDKLLAIKVDNYDLHNYLYRLDLIVEYEQITKALSNIHDAVLKCFNDKDLLSVTVDFISELSFMNSSFTIKVLEFKEDMSWNN